MTWVAVAVGVGSAVVGAAGSKAIADEQSRGNRAANALQQQQLNMAYTAYVPNRSMGYQAGSDLSNLYGWSTPGYTPLNALLAGGGGGGLSVSGDNGGRGGGVGGLVNGAMNASSFGRFGRGATPDFGGSIDPLTGTVDLNGKHLNKESALTNYLRTGVWEGGGGGKTNSVKSAIDQLRAQGWSYGADGQGHWAGEIAAQPAGQPGNMSRFFTSPDYQFRLGEQNKLIEQGAAQRGQYFGPNTQRDLVKYGGNLASGEYQNYVNNLFQAMGYGQNATNASVNAGSTATNNMGQLAQNQGDIRASGIQGQYGAGLGLLNTLGNIYGDYLGNKRMDGLSPVDIYTQRIGG